MQLGLGNSLVTQNRASGGAVDPLAGITFALRLQTHLGDNVPFGLYQDTACTVKATADGNPVAAWRDELSGSGLIASQSNAMQQPKLRFRSGVPVVTFDGVDDVLLLSSLDSDDFVWIATAQTGGSVNSFRAIVDNANVTSYFGHSSNEGGKACIIDGIGALRLGGSLSTNPEVWLAYEDDGLHIDQNGTEVFALPGTGIGSGSMRIGKAGNDSAAWDGDITAVLFTDVLPGAQTELIELTLGGLQPS